MKVTYKWKEQFRLRRKLDADAVGQELAELRAEGDASPKAMWRRARSTKSAMHNGFTWDVQKAAEERWEEQARYILQHHVLHTVNDVVVEGEVRSTLFIPEETARGRQYEHGQWIDVPRALSTKEGTRQVLTLALAELAFFKQKYEHLKELSTVIAAISKVLQKAKPKPKPRRKA